MDVTDRFSTRLRLDLAYDGGAFSGWAVQPGRRTVEGELTGGLERLLRVPVRLVVAGRTDAGVHATGQVAHVDVDSAVLAERVPQQDVLDATLVRRLAGVLPPDLVVRRVSVAPPGFDARFAALWRRYRYRISDEPALRDPLTRHAVLWVQRPLCVPAMNAAARQLLGLRDFAAYAKPRPGATTVRELQVLDVVRREPGRVDVVVQADAFCHNMVRALVGGLLDVGWGRRDPDYPAAVLESRSRKGAGAVLPAHGLTLEQVCYPESSEMATRVARTTSGERRTTQQ